MLLVDGGKPSDRETRFATFVVANWDVSEPSQAEEAAHSALAMLVTLAKKWNPYWVVGLMRCTMDAISEWTEEADG